MKHHPLTKQETEQFLNEIRDLDERQVLTLHNFSARLLNGTGYCSGIDLLHEVIKRVIDGSRYWRRDIPIGSFLHESMRSVASVDTRNPQRRPISYEDWMAVGADPEADDEFTCSPEEMMIKRQEEELRHEVFRSAKNRLFHDKIASTVLNGLTQDLTPAEIRKAYGISESGYKAARAKITMEIRALSRSAGR